MVIEPLQMPDQPQIGRDDFVIKVMRQQNVAWSLWSVFQAQHALEVMMGDGDQIESSLGHLLLKLFGHFVFLF